MQKTGTCNCGTTTNRKTGHDWKCPKCAALEGHKNLGTRRRKAGVHENVPSGGHEKQWVDEGTPICGESLKLLEKMLEEIKP